MRDHQTGGAIFEEAVEAVFLLRDGAPHTIDVRSVMTAERGFDLTRLPGAVFCIHPDAVIVEMSGHGRKEGDGGAGGADACDLTGAEFGENFGRAHGGGVSGKSGINR